MAQRITITVRDTPVDVEFVFSRQIEDWVIGSWWSDNERITHRDVELAADDVICERGQYWNTG